MSKTVADLLKDALALPEPDRAKLADLLGVTFTVNNGPVSQNPPDAERLPRVRVGSPRLAEPRRAIDFTMEVAEDSRDADLR